MEQIVEYILIILKKRSNRIFSDKEIILEVRKKLGITDEMLVKRTLTMMAREGIIILDHTEDGSYVDDFGYHAIKRRFFTAKNPKPLIQMQLYSYFG